MLIDLYICFLLESSIFLWKWLIHPISNYIVCFHDSGELLLAVAFRLYDLRHTGFIERDEVNTRSTFSLILGLVLCCWRFGSFTWFLRSSLHLSLLLLFCSWRRWSWLFSMNPICIFQMMSWKQLLTRFFFSLSNNLGFSLYILSIVCWLRLTCAIDVCSGRW